MVVTIFAIKIKHLAQFDDIMSSLNE